MPRLDRILFFGTPDFALPTLQALVSAGRTPLLVVTQPDRPAGRGQRVQAGAVARCAREQGLEVELSDARAMSQTRSPFRDVPALVAYIYGLQARSA